MRIFACCFILRTMDFSKPYDANQEVVVVLAEGK